MNNTSKGYTIDGLLQQDIDMTLDHFHTIQVVILTFMLAGCLFGNILVICAITRTKKLRTPSNYLVINMSVCDMITAIGGIPFTLIAFNMIFKASTFPYGAIGCKLLWPITTYASTCSVFTLASLSVERYASISSISLMFTKRRSLFIVAGIHAVALVVVIPYMIKLNYLEYGDRAYCIEIWSEQWQSKVYTVSLFVLQYALPLLVMTAFYFLAWRKVYEKNKMVIKMSEDYERKMDYRSTTPPASRSANSSPKQLSRPSSWLEEYLQEQKRLAETRRKILCWGVRNMLRKEMDTPATLNKSGNQTQKTLERERLSQENIHRDSMLFCRQRPEIKRLQSSFGVQRSNRGRFLSETSCVRHKQSIRMLKMFTTVVLVFACFALPNQLNWVLMHFSHIPHNVADIFVVLSYVSSVVNCWIYGIFHSGIRDAYVSVLCGESCQKSYRRRQSQASTCTTMTIPMTDYRGENGYHQRPSSFDSMFQEQRARESMLASLQ